jgi:hypothetical protein
VSAGHGDLLRDHAPADRPLRRRQAEIATQLCVREGTVKTHVARILVKPDLRERTQAVIYAYENSLVQPRQN